ncbi:glycosyltransferase family 25 protein [Nitratireductor sp. XY-223]|uniref:glycosyltransferase family 25 protein n=1 Tax=Nitratireductor sp. XY-223 TaxID=2561926 RepID=UPI0010AA012F|nr:glycosyltransferase family 25 protein [Nitratireductor sp. XY-223]
MDTYLINLERSSDRLARMKSRFDRINVPFKRVPAIDGRLLDSSAVERFLSKRRNRRWNYGEVGCFLSHLKAWRTFADSGDAHAAFFEDDAYLSSGLSGLLSSPDWIPGDADVVRLETTFWRTEISCEKTKVTNRHEIHELLALHHGAGAYILTQKAANFLLGNEQMLRTTLDSALFDFQEPSCKALKIYQVCPAPVLQETVYKSMVDNHVDALSEITRTDWIPTPELPLKARKLLREIRRPFKQIASRSAQYKRVRSGQSFLTRVPYYGNASGSDERLYAPTV